MRATAKLFIVVILNIYEFSNVSSGGLSSDLDNLKEPDKKYAVSLLSDKTYIVASKTEFAAQTADGIRNHTKAEMTDAVTVISAAEKTALKLIGRKIRLLVKKHTRGISDPNFLNRYVYALFLTMNSFNYRAWNSAWGVAWQAAWEASFDLGLNGDTRSLVLKSVRIAARKSAWQSAWSAAWNQGMQANLDARDANWNAAYLAVKAEAKSVLAGKKTVNPKDLGELAWQSAEKEMLNYFARPSEHDEFKMKFEESIEVALKSIDESPTAAHAMSIFRSQETWKAFKVRKFAKLNDEAKSYLKEWIKTANGLVLKIEHQSSASPSAGK